MLTLYFLVCSFLYFAAVLAFENVFFLELAKECVNGALRCQNWCMVISPWNLFTCSGIFFISRGSITRRGENLTLHGLLAWKVAPVQVEVIQRSWLVDRAVFKLTLSDQHWPNPTWAPNTHFYNQEWREEKKLVDYQHWKRSDMKPEERGRWKWLKMETTSSLLIKVPTLLPRFYSVLV